jgi:hypothetical protein
MSNLDHQKPMKARRYVLACALVVLVAAIVAGCGGGGSSSSSTGTVAVSGGSGGSSSSSAGSSSTTEAAPAAAVVRTKDPVSEGSAAVEIEPRISSFMKDNDEISTTGAKPVKPCKLVTRKEASAILGKGTTVAERPQGPTCVYSNAGRTVTLAVEVNSVKRLRQDARKATKVDIDGRTGWCVKYQSTTVVIGIGEGRVLRADGPCQAGTRFVAKALPRI